MKEGKDNNSYIEKRNPMEYMNQNTIYFAMLLTCWACIVWLLLTNRYIHLETDGVSRIADIKLNNN